ncbi:MAG: hypothetical protein IJ475_02430 [Bacilli bacterium]|nr:hypothetical protein [Bacilli bacterium]
MAKVNAIKTIVITSFLFVFICFMVYLIYCYAIYDKVMESRYIDYYNDVKLDNLYDVLYVDDLSKEDFNVVTNIMYDKNYLEEIYNTYYIDSTLYSGFDDFVSHYYYGYFNIENDDVEFIKEGKSTINSKRKLTLKKINVYNDKSTSVLGIVTNIKFGIEEKSRLYLDEVLLDCVDNICNIDKLFGGIHTIKYESNGHSYFGLVNINKDNIEISVANLDSLVIYERNEVDLSLKLKTGHYKVDKCFLSSGCPNKNSSYTKLYEDGTAEYYIFVTFDQAGDYYKGKYEMNNGFLTLYFKEHVYYVFDYDTKVTTKIPATTDVYYQFKITSESSFVGDEYSFYLS